MYRGPRVKACNDEVSQMDEYDDQFSELLFFIGSINMGQQAPHIKTPTETFPISADQLINVGEDGDNCCCKMEKMRLIHSLSRALQPYTNLSLVREKE
jgi:hypothetical protein